MKFIAGFIFAFIVIGIGAFVYVHLGFADIRADQKPTQLETWFAGGGMDNSAERHAPNVKNPMEPTEANLHDGMVVYTMNCAVCHGTPAGDSEIGQREYPPAPQFMKDAADMPENQNFYIIKHGIRLSAMPGWDKTLSDDKIWKVVTFLANMDKLPANVDKDWKGNTPAPEVPAPAQQSAPQSERKHSHGHP
jgi:mono/diheme cytochrome c family protein